MESNAFLRARRIGVGTGSTVKLVLERLLEDSRTRATLVGKAKLYASSLDTLLFLEERGIHASPVLPGEGLDLYFDGADEVAMPGGVCQAVKGRGAAHTREKVFAYASSQVYLVVDESKKSETLGEKGKPVPVEVIAPAYRVVRRVLESKGVVVEERKCNCRDGPGLTDNCNPVLDTWPWRVFDPYRYEGLLDTIPGVVGHGLFIGYMDEIVVGTSDGANVYSCRRTRRARPLRET